MKKKNRTEMMLNLIKPAKSVIFIFLILSFTSSLTLEFSQTKFLPCLKVPSDPGLEAVRSWCNLYLFTPAPIGVTYVFGPESYLSFFVFVVLIPYLLACWVANTVKKPNKEGYRTTRK